MVFKRHVYISRLRFPFRINYDVFIITNEVLVLRLLFREHTSLFERFQLEIWSLLYFAVIQMPLVLFINTGQVVDRVEIHLQKPLNQVINGHYFDLSNFDLGARLSPCNCFFRQSWIDVFEFERICFFRVTCWIVAVLGQ